MIKIARTRHFVIWVLLAVLIPVVFLLGVVMRHEDPVNRSIPEVERSFGDE